MDYKHDIFISYRRSDEIRDWLDKHFIPLLKFHVSNDLGRTPVVYYDEQLETGSIWPVKLGEEISASRILITLWTGSFLNSKWCTCEVSHMRLREDTYRQGMTGDGLVVPFVIHDGNTIPHDLGGNQKIEIIDCFSVRMKKHSDTAEKLERKIAEASPGIANAITKAPKWQNNWKIDAVNRFYTLYFKGENSDQNNLPTYT